MTSLLRISIFLKVILFVLCDIYLHNPRGSNNRLDEATRERKNPDRLFDSQNNERGGYNVGKLYYFVNSKLQIEWTNQHSCNHENNNCEIILQYMCGTNTRDGASTRSIPTDLKLCSGDDCDTDLEFGMHEDYEYYLNCNLRERNIGLFTADQNMKNKNRAINTRQNNDGKRRGYECPEERDYYPYWHPTPWKDIAILTNDADRCDYYIKESENIKGRWMCYMQIKYLLEMKEKRIQLPSTKEDCEEFQFEGIKAEWKYILPHNISNPICRQTEFSRDNHLGNTIGGQPILFNWTIPDDVNENCVLRVRYNISTNDYDPWRTTSSSNAGQNQDAKVSFTESHGFGDDSVAGSRGWTFENNPKVALFDDIPGFKLQLAINTAQFGRTFQDRSHTFAIRRSDIGKSAVHNINVRGKRGNIVQVYPAVEYDFVPNTLILGTDDYFHFQWTGSNTNPNNNDGQGQAGSDRSNVLLMKDDVSLNELIGNWRMNYPDHFSNLSNSVFSTLDLKTLAILDPGQLGGEMSELDDAGTYFDLGPRKITKTGTYHYMSTRNNNFSNRSQKGRLVGSNDTISDVVAIDQNGGSLSTENGDMSVIIEKGVLNKLVKFQLEVIDFDMMEQSIDIKNNVDEFLKTTGGRLASAFFVLHPQEVISHDGQLIQVKVKIDHSRLDHVDIYRTNLNNLATRNVEKISIENGYAIIQTNSGGMFFAVKRNKVGAIVTGVVLALVVILILISGAFIYNRRNPTFFQSLLYSVRPKV